MKIGICGVRGLGRHFLELFARHPQVESVTFADLDADVRAKAHKVAPAAKACETFEQLLDTDVDSIAIFTPPWVHARMAVQALQAGKHVVSACPAGLTLGELRALVGAVEQSGRIYMIAETSYYYTGVMYAREAWAQGRFGDLVYAEGEYYFRPHAYGFWMRDGYGNMPPMLYPTHSTTMTISVTGKRFERVTCVGTPSLHPDMAALPRRPEWQNNQVSNMTMLGTMSGGGVCRINEMRNVGCKGELGSILGTLGSIRQHSGGVAWTNGFHWDVPQGRVQDIDLTALWRDPAHHPQTALKAKMPASYAGADQGHEGSHPFLADEFVRAVTTNRRPHNNVWEAAKYCAPGIVAWESLKQNSAWLEVPDLGNPTDGRERLAY